MKNQKIVIDEQGKAFLQADAFGNERELFLCAAFDGVSVAWQDGKTLFLPADWLAGEFPEHAERIRELVESVQTQIGEKP